LKYPRVLEEDIKLLEEVHCDVLFCPADTEIYPTEPHIKFDFGPLDKVMEGKFRPGHFSGVGLVVSKLLNIIQPDVAYFGQKDWQQFAVITQLVTELNFDVKLQSVATLRERSGLALSSRNMRLTEKERVQASVFFRALKSAQQELSQGKNLSEVKSSVKNIVESEKGITLEYFELVDSKNLNQLENVSQSEHPILCIAGFVGEVRLIDNMFVFPDSQ
jgi:pantoate--beta-alanine ligase